MEKDLDGKVILLTGGASGIGRECAIAYARDGATVAIVDRNFEEAEGAAKEIGNRSTAYRADVSSGPEVETAITALLKEYGRLDAVHNNAGIVSPSCPLHETTEEQWDDLHRTNLKSVYWTTKFAFSALVESKGAILNTASMVGLLGQQDHAAYVATKGGMISLTKAMAADYAVPDQGERGMPSRRMDTMFE
jgi:NAD(P)-dependent dehydrogenase (short-subunit alcohol dehydrogenase family)